MPESLDSWESCLLSSSDDDDDDDDDDEVSDLSVVLVVDGKRAAASRASVNIICWKSTAQKGHFVPPAS